MWGSGGGYDYGISCSVGGREIVVGGGFECVLGRGGEFGSS